MFNHGFHRLGAFVSIPFFFMFACKQPESTGSRKPAVPTPSQSAQAGSQAGSAWTDQERGDAMVLCLQFKGDATKPDNHMACQCLVKVLADTITYGQFSLVPKEKLAEAAGQATYKTCYDEQVAAAQKTTTETTAGWAQATLLENNNDSDATKATAVFNGEDSALMAWGQMSGGEFAVWGKAYSKGFWQQSLPIATLPGADIQPVFPISIGYTASGEGVVVWDSYGVGGTETNYLDVYSSVYTPNVGWSLSTPGIVSTTGGNFHEYHPIVASNCGGDVVAAWMQTNHGVWVNRYKSGTGWGTPVRVSADVATLYPLIACDATGGVIVAYGPATASTGGPFVATYNPTSNTWNAPVQLGPALTGSISSLTVDTDGKGRLMVLWGQTDAGQTKLYFTSSGENYTTIQQLNQNQTLGQTWNAEMAADAQGNVMAVWFNYTAEKAVWSSYYTAANKTWGNAVQVNQGTQSAYSMAAGVFAQDAGVFVTAWLENNGATTAPMWAQFKEGVWSTKTAVSDLNLAGKDTDRSENSPVLVWDRKGTALLLYRKQEGTRYDLYGSIFKK